MEDWLCLIVMFPIACVGAAFAYLVGYGRGEDKFYEDRNKGRLG